MTELEIHQPDFETLLQYLKRNRGFDFTGYKRNSVMRRVEKRMSDIGVEGYSHYVDYLEVHPEEFSQLFNTILINVTAFFRDPAAWDFIRDEVIQRIIVTKGLDDPIRIWSAGCASGEEAYTLAMLLAEALGFERFRDRVKIYATDIDEEALTEARQASYTAREVIGVPAEYLERYFERSASRYVFHKDLRRAVIFGRHDLIQDAPISRIDLLVCRNAMMYFNAEIQSKILARLHFALSDTGYLFLGKAEMLFTHSNLFTPVDLKLRVFNKVMKGTLRDRLLLMTQTGSEEDVDHLTDHVQMREIVFETGPIAQIVIGLTGMLALANDRARNLFRLSHRDMNRPLQDLEISYRPVELRSCIEQAYNERRVVVVKDVPWPPAPGETGFLDVQVVPLQDNAGSILGAAVTFTDVTRFKQLQGELLEANRELETAYEELQSTNEELETTNEELQSTVEELETTNEELQSTNEELETMNEELQSTNEELQTMNEEMRHSSGDFKRANTFLGAILSSMRGGVVVLDNNLEVQIWNSKAEELWGLRSEEVQNKHFFSLDIGLPVDRLKPSIRACLSGSLSSFEDTIEATNRRGKAIICKVTCTTLINGEDLFGVIMVME
ncbi:chemotaxis protein CheR [Capsulimonas corticalis]|uniref:protein-glutamate O-methyltransferase n=1 Tax=Capsulimonas corticalis TaxID=2219043 RepID=A0A402D245_9BACT|nr:CheR family methyltransferase [Capsulimonas corticalis]BDI30145.1 chemotaxis protein CheR [Capsulimonas corticalis]